MLPTLRQVIASAFAHLSMQGTARTARAPVFLAAAALCLAVAGCAGGSAASVPTPVIVVTVLPPPPSATPIVCSPNPPGLSIQVEAGGFHRVRITGSGFKPGEVLLLVLTSPPGPQVERVEARPAQGVNADGSFSDDETLMPPSGTEASPVTWSIAVVHSRGVACATVKVF